MDTSKGYADAIWASRILVAELRRDLRLAEREAEYRLTVAEEWLYEQGWIVGKNAEERRRQLALRLREDSLTNAPVLEYRAAETSADDLRYRLEGALNMLERERDRRRDYENLLRERALGVETLEQPDEKPF